MHRYDADLRYFLLALYTNKPLPSEEDSKDTGISEGKLQPLWANVIETTQRFDDLRRAQLYRLAALYDRYPQYLEKASDPKQVYQKNVEQISSQLRFKARKFPGHWPLFIFKDDMQEFRHDLFPIVPLDSSLELFTETLQRWRLDSNSDKLLSEVMSPSDPSSKDNATAERKMAVKDDGADEKAFGYCSRRFAPARTPRPPFIHPQYPPEIAEAIERAISGLAYVYTTSGPLREHRLPGHICPNGMEW